MAWITIDLSYACGHIELNSYGFVISTPPIFNWMINKHESEILKWVDKKGGKIIKHET